MTHKALCIYHSMIVTVSRVTENVDKLYKIFDITTRHLGVSVLMCLYDCVMQGNFICIATINSNLHNTLTVD